MIKRLTILLVFLLIGIVTHAQTENKIAISAFFGVYGPSDGSATLGPGIGLKAEFPVVPRLKFMFNASLVNNFYGDRSYAYAPIPQPNGATYIPTGPANDGPYQFVPVTAGFRYYYYHHFYIEGEAGEAFKANVTNTTFIYGGTFGGLIRLSQHSALDLNLHYTAGYKFQDYNDRTGEAALRVGYRYQL